MTCSLEPAGGYGVAPYVTSEQKPRSEYTNEDWHNWNRTVVDEFRRNGGTVSGALAGAPILLLTTTGRRTGLPRMAPLTYLRDEERMIVFASKGGSPRLPSWYLNLLADPRATAELPNGRHEVVATVLAGAERAELWARQKQEHPVFAHYEKIAGREIPVIAFLPTEG
jgi:deazaflavin-dependent oxidoreductase (nitroreductase family)